MQEDKATYLGFVSKVAGKNGQLQIVSPAGRCCNYLGGCVYCNYLEVCRTRKTAIRAILFLAPASHSWCFKPLRRSFSAPFAILATHLFFLCWCFISLVFVNIAVHIAVLGSDVARVTPSPETVPFNLLEYDLASLVCQCLFLTGIFALSFNAGSHTSPPPWATHRGRHRSRGTDFVRDQDVSYATAGSRGCDSPVHAIGLDSDGHTSA